MFPDTGIAKSALEFEIEKPGSVLQFYHTDGIGGTFIHGYSILPLKNVCSVCVCLCLREKRTLSLNIIYQTVFPTIQVWEFQTPVDYNIIAMSDLVDTGNNEPALLSRFAPIIIMTILIFVVM